MKWLARFLFDHLTRRVLMRRKPDVIIGERDAPYMHRWWLIPKNPLFNVYLHRFMRSDEDRALHDHPWANLSFLLYGEYTEHTQDARVIRRAGDFKLRGPSSAHRIELHDGWCWTMFITGPRVRHWGFHCPRGWVHWEDFTDTRDGASVVGKGCDA